MATTERDGEELLTVSEVARLLSVEDETVRRWIRNGAMQAKHVGPSRLIRITRAEVQRHLAPYGQAG